MRKIEDLLSNIKMVVMDFDGIHTDGHVYVNSEGNEYVKCSRKDGLGLKMLQEHGIHLLVISKETNAVVSARCKKLKIDYIQSVGDSSEKKEILKKKAKEFSVEYSDILYIGDDINDIDPIRFAGVGVTVSDGHDLVKKEVDIVLQSAGGKHALRELSEVILTSQGVQIEKY